MTSQLTPVALCQNEIQGAQIRGVVVPFGGPRKFLVERRRREDQGAKGVW